MTSRRILFILSIIFLFTGCSLKSKEPKLSGENINEQSDPESEKNRTNHRKTTPILQKLTYTDSTGFSIPYQLYTPSSPEKGCTYPVVLFLHGAGERGSDNELQANDTGVIPCLIAEDFYSQNPSIILAPQCDIDQQWVDTPWTKGSYSIEETPVSDELSAVTELLSEICQNHPADTGRIYAAGVSMGGFGTWDMLLRNPDVFAGAIILCGAGDPTHVADIADIPLWIFHGSKDTEVPLAGSTDMVQALKDTGAANVHYTEYPDIGHWIWMAAWEEPELLTNLFKCLK